MTLTPRYGIVYRDGYHEAGRPFEIDPADAAEMAQHGEVSGAEQTSIFSDDEPKPKTRRKKTAE